VIEILNDQERRAITGTAIKRLQVRWFASHSWPFEVDHFGAPVVLRSFAMKKLGGEVPAETWSLDESNVA